MIIFNIYAFIEAIILAIVWVIVYFICPRSIFESNAGMLILAITGLMVTGFTASSGLKGRVFFIPTWIFFMLIVVILIPGLYGWTGVIVTLVSIAGLVALGAYLIDRSDKKAWEEAPAELAKAHELQYSSNKFNFWTALSKAFMAPSFMKYTPEMCAHNYQVADLLFQRVNMEEHYPIIEVYKKLMEEGSRPHDRPFKMESKVTDAVKAILADRVEAFKKTEEVVPANG